MTTIPRPASACVDPLAECCDLARGKGSESQGMRFAGSSSTRRRRAGCRHRCRAHSRARSSASEQSFACIEAQLAFGQGRAMATHAGSGKDGCTSRVKSSVEGACGAQGPGQRQLLPRAPRRPPRRQRRSLAGNFSSSDSPLLTGIVIPIEAIQEIRAISPKCGI